MVELQKQETPLAPDADVAPPPVMATWGLVMLVLYFVVSVAVLIFVDMRIGAVMCVATGFIVKLLTPKA